MQAVNRTNSIVDFQKPESQGFRWTVPLFGAGAVLGLSLGVAALVMQVVVVIPVVFFVLSAFLIFASIESYRFGGLESSNTELANAYERINLRCQEEITAFEDVEEKYKLELAATQKEVKRLKRENQELSGEIVIPIETSSSGDSDDVENNKGMIRRLTKTFSGMFITEATQEEFESV